MFARSINESILHAEGHPTISSSTDPSQGGTPHKMTFWYNFVDPSHSRKLHPELPPKPVVDVSSPFNLLDETHQVRKFGVQKLGWDFLSLNELTGAHEDVPYTESHHTSEIVRLWLVALNVLQWNYFMARGQASGGILGGGPRTRFAWNIAFFMSQVRVNIAGLIGAGGYFYAYEYLYTHGPSCFRIKDPSPNAYKRAWDDGQSTYLSRAVASVFPALGYAFYAGRFKRASFWFVMTLGTSLYYEYARKNILSGNRLFYSYLANQQADREAGFGSLTPRLKRRVDPDTNRNESVAQYRYFRITNGELQNTVWENAVHENLPLVRTGIKIQNPYFNWKKAPQTYEEKPYKVKNDLWQLPQVLDVRMRSGALDQFKENMTAKRNQRKPSATAVQRNATAVQKIFTEHHARAKALAGVVSSNPVGTTGSPRSPTYATDPVSRDAPVSGPLLPKHSAEAVTGRILAGQIQPEWQQTSRRGVQAHKGHLDIPSHLSQQFELAMEMKQQTAEWGSSPATSASNGLSGPSSPSALSSLPTTGEEQRHNVGGRPVDRKDLLHYEACERPGDPRCSNFAMTLCKSKHQMYIPSAKENPTLTYSGPHGGRERGHSVPVNAVKARREKRAEFHRQQSIARYEKTLPLRRAADPYMQLTGAQADARVSVPTEHTLQLLSERYEGRHPVAGNPYRQELYRGEPLMRQVLRGDFYESAVPATASKPHRTASSPAVRTGKPSSTNFIQKNKRNVREWSDFNTANRYPN